MRIAGLRRLRIGGLGSGPLGHIGLSNFGQSVH
jgi:hypothetical protein